MEVIRPLQVITASVSTVSASVSGRLRHLTCSYADLLEVSLVNAKGQHLVLNQHTDPDYFYAIRGGGGSAWGVSIADFSSLSSHKY